ncbi:unnamed protein product [Arctogadus glacialis]
MQGIAPDKERDAEYYWMASVPPSPADVRTLDAPSSLNFSGDTHGGCLVKVRSLQAHRGWKSPALLQGHPECECSLPMAALPSRTWDSQSDPRGGLFHPMPTPRQAPD